MRKHTFYLQFILFAIIFSSCEKVIDLDLNSKDPKIVIEGNVDDQSGPYQVRISTSIDFDETNNFPAVTGAQVIINDNQSGNDTLDEIEPGLYQTNTLQGIYGHTYTLSVLTTSGKAFTSTATMPQPVPFDSLILDSLEFFGNSTLTFTPIYTDPGTTGNRYRFIAYHNSTLMDDIFVFADRFNNGLVNARPLVVDEDEEWLSGDSAIVIKQDIDIPIFDYFFSMQLNQDGGTAAPANPTSNISNGALGYFSVHTLQRKAIVIP